MADIHSRILYPISGGSDAPEPEPEPVEPVAVSEPEPSEPDNHPLEPGGKRFAEVYADMKDARRQAEDSQRQVQDLQSRLSQLESRTPPPQQEKTYSAQELQALVDAGRITPALMADQLAYQRTLAMKQELRKESHEETKRTSALGEVNAFLEKIPALRDSRSGDFSRVATEAYRIADETGLSTQDPRVQRLALRAVYGPLDKVVNVKQTREFERRNADTYVETERGGQPAGKAKDPLKDVPQVYRDHWKRLGYSQEQMLAEAKYITPRSRRG